MKVFLNLAAAAFGGRDADILLYLIASYYLCLIPIPMETRDFPTHVKLCLFLHLL